VCPVVKTHKILKWVKKTHFSSDFLSVFTISHRVLIARFWQLALASYSHYEFNVKKNVLVRLMYIYTTVDVASIATAFIKRCWVINEARV